MADEDSTPTFRELSETIISIHGPGDAEFVWFWSDNHDGRVHRILPRFWSALRARDPAGSIDDVVAAWSDAELRTVYRGLLYPPEGDAKYA